MNIGRNLNESSPFVGHLTRRKFIVFAVQSDWVIRTKFRNELMG